MPCTGWTKLATIEPGRWAEWRAEEVEVPAALGCGNGVWSGIRRGLQGELVREEKGVARISLIGEPVRHHSWVITQSG